MKLPWPSCLKCCRKSEPEEPPADPQEPPTNPGEPSDPQPEPQPTPPGIKPKSGAVTLLLAVLICGAGHIYAGRVRRGLILLGISIALTVVVSVMWAVGAPATFDSIEYFWVLDVMVVLSIAQLVCGLVFYAWTIYDAWKVHKQYNTVLAETGVPPW